MYQRLRRADSQRCYWKSCQKIGESVDFLLSCLNNGELKLANQRSHLGCMREEGPRSRYAHIRQRDEYSRNHFVRVLIEASSIGLPQKDVFPRDTSPNLCPFLLLDTDNQF
jgi:hypothetical protein